MDWWDSRPVRAIATGTAYAGLILVDKHLGIGHAALDGIFQIALFLVAAALIAAGFAEMYLEG